MRQVRLAYEVDSRTHVPTLDDIYIYIFTYTYYVLNIHKYNIYIYIHIAVRMTMAMVFKGTQKANIADRMFFLFSIAGCDMNSFKRDDDYLN